METATGTDPGAVRSMFNAIAPRYDLLNRLLSAGLDQYWRRRAIRHLRGARPRSVLDVACGTGDLAIAASRLRPDRIVGVDVAESMLEMGRRKLARRGLEGLIDLRTGNAENLPFPDESFDAVTVAFGVRNFGNLTSGLAEMLRILRPGGKVVILEFARPARFPFRTVYYFYFRRILPLIGRSVSSHPHAYTYLPETVLRFPEGGEFLSLLGRAGFKNTRQERLTGGVAAVYTGEKP